MRLPDDAHWRVERATRASVVVDADNYFRAARQAMLNAKHQILLVGWDFDARIRLAWDDDHPEAPSDVGAFITWLVKRTPGLQVHILRWDTGAMKTLGRGKTLWTLLNVIDDCLAFCGGIDMTDERWDTRAHRDDDAHRRSPGGRAYKPWHDVTTALQGPVAKALGDLCRNRWEIAGGAPISPPPARDPGCWPESLPPQFTDVDVAISRSQPEHDGQEEVLEIERLYLALIAGATKRIYAESQYFASRRIAEAIAKRLVEDDPPEIVVINPVKAQGWLEPIAMDTARARLVAELKKRDRHGRFRIYHPVTERGAAIYCHAKVTVIDEAAVRIGSSNFNNRSLRLDTECDVTITEEPETIAAIRADLLAEHLGADPADVAARIERDGLIATIEDLRGQGRTLIPYEIDDLTGVEKWLADNEVLDPEGPAEMFESFAKRGLLRRLRRRSRR